MTPDLILGQFDSAAKNFVFPMLDNGYVYPADVRLSIFRDEVRWLIIVEVLGVYVPKVSGCNVFQNCLHLFGSDLHREPGLANEDFLYPIDSLPDDPLFEDEYDWYVRPHCQVLGIRGYRIGVDLSTEALSKRGLELLDPPNVHSRMRRPSHRPSLSIADVNVVEEDVGTANVEFTVTLSAASDVIVSVGYSTFGLTASADFQQSSARLKFASGVTTQTITVPVVGDDDETVGIKLSEELNATIARAQAKATIVDNDPPPTVLSSTCLYRKVTPVRRLLTLR